MKIIVCGAGQIGTSISQYLADDGHHLVVIDQDADLIRTISNSLDVQGIIGFSSHPDVLKRAGASDADMVIAVTQSDEINMMTCQVAHSLFKIKTKIARIRDQSYLDPRWAMLFSPTHLPIDLVISPEEEVAKSIARNLQTSEINEVIPLSQELIKAIGVRCSEESPIINTPLRQIETLFHDLSLTILSIYRDGTLILPTATEQLRPQDEVYLVTETEHLPRVLAAFGIKPHSSSHVVILGGGGIGYSLARTLYQLNPQQPIKIIEQNAERCAFLSQSLPFALILHGSALDVNILEEAVVQSANAVVSVLIEDADNMIACLIAKQQGAPKTVALIGTPAYTTFVSSLGINSFVSSRNITVSTILQYIRKGKVISVHPIYEGGAEIIEADIEKNSHLIGHPLKTLKVPGQVIIGAIIRDQEVLMPHKSLYFKEKDRVIFIAKEDAINSTTNLFQKSDY